MAVLFCLFAFTGSLSAQNATVNETVTFKVENGNGDYTWPVPTEMNGLPITVTHIRFEAIGGGGAGGYIYDHRGGEAASGGGGGGAYTYLEVANPQETSYTIHVGKGGTSIASSRTNTDGEFSSVSATGGFILKAAGGKTVVPTNHGLSTNYYTFAGALGGQVADCIPEGNASAGGNGSNGSYSTLSTYSGEGGYAEGPAGIAGMGGHTDNKTYLTSGGATGNPGFNYGGGGSGAQGYSVRVVGNNIERNGGAGANGVVIVTYSYETNANVVAEDAEATVCNDMTFELPLNIVLTNLTYDDIAFDFNQIIFVSEYVTRVGEFSVDENFVLTGKFHNSAAEAKPYVLTVSIRTSGNNPTELASLIVNFNVNDSLKVGSVTLDDNACNNAIVVMGEATGGSGTYTYAWLDDNQLIPDANGLSYSPTSGPTHYISGVVNDVVCGIADTSRPAVTVFYHHSAHPIDPGIIGRNDTIVCPNNTYTTTLYANTTASGTIQWQRKYNDNEWQNVISHGPSHGKGWAVPTLAQYNALMAVAGSVENLKATTGWLPEYVGTNETGFTAIAPGFYNASADQFQKHLTFAGFWTSSRSDVAGTGVIFEINYNCDNGTPSGAPEANKYSVRCVKVNEE